ncbi:hypothetical protein [Nostoc sp.]|uniref:hypothetical protein n=1 Tax=Nostoc sp. TaxID=1180 RepID=UPI002FF6A09C
MSDEFQQRSQEAITQLAGKNYGNTAFENEKRSYPRAMIDFLAGNREKAIASLFWNQKMQMLKGMLTPWVLTFTLVLPSKVKSANTSILANILTQTIASE